MRKIDLANVEVIRRLVYPEPFYRETEGYEGQRVGNAVCRRLDVGVAGLWRLTSRLGEIKSHPIVIAVAGMDAALVSVLGGLIPGIMIGVPTSTGYGAARNGETALGASLSSCAPGVTICNIDNGYGAAMAAIRMLRGMETNN